MLINILNLLRESLPNAIGGILTTVIVTIFATGFAFFYTRYKKRQNAIVPTEEEIKDLDDILNLRNKYRIEFTKLAMLYYDSQLDETYKNLLPKDISVLVKEEYLPITPIEVSELNNRLVWHENIDSLKPLLDYNLAKILVQSSPGRKLYNGYIYRLIETDGNSFEFTKGNYFGFLNTCEYLSYEMSKAIFQNKFYYDYLVKGDLQSLERVVKFLIQNPDVIPFRSKSDPFDFKSRITAFGTCSLVILKKTKKENVFILNERSSQLAETPNLVHVIPAGTFQPNTQNNQFHIKEFAFTENIYREFIEELIEDIHIRQNPQPVLNFDEMYGGKGRAFRKAIIEPNNLDLLYLGTVIDPVNLKPEILTVLLLHEGHFEKFLNEKRQLEISWETGTSIRFHEFTKERLFHEINNSNLVPTGKAHLHLVLRHYEFINERLRHI